MKKTFFILHISYIVLSSLTHTMEITPFFKIELARSIERSKTNQHNNALIEKIDNTHPTSTKKSKPFNFPSGHNKTLCLSIGCTRQINNLPVHIPTPKKNNGALDVIKKTKKETSKSTKIHTIPTMKTTWTLSTDNRKLLAFKRFLIKKFNAGNLRNLSFFIYDETKDLLDTVQYDQRGTVIDGYTPYKRAIIQSNKNNFGKKCTITYHPEKCIANIYIKFGEKHHSYRKCMNYVLPNEQLFLFIRKKS